MANVKIGHITLPVDADSISFVDIKNNISVPAIRGGIPQAIPTGSSNMGIRINVLFPSIEDVNASLREIVALMRGMPFINIQSDIISACYFLGLKDDKLKDVYLNRAKELADRYLDLQTNRAQNVSELLIDVIVKDLLHPTFVSVATTPICTEAIRSFLAKDDYKYINDIFTATKGDPRPSAGMIVADILRLYKECVSQFAKNRNNSKILTANNEVTEPALIAKFIQLVTKGEGEFSRDVIDAARSPLISTVALTFPTDLGVALDGDDLEIPKLPGISYVMGIATYQETEGRGSQAYYQRNLASYNNSLAVKSAEYWNDNWNFLAKTYYIDKDRDSVVDFISTANKTVPAPIGGTVLAGESAGLHLVKQGYAIPRSIQSLGMAGPKDLPFINAAIQAAENNLGMWNNANTVSVYFNDGHNLQLGNTFATTTIKPRDASSYKMFMPASFNAFEPKLENLYRVPHSTIQTYNATSINLADDIVQFDMKIANGVELSTVKIRALNIKQANISFQEFINEYYYFMTLGRKTASLSHFSNITYFGDVAINDNSNPNPYYLNAIIGPENLSDINGSSSDDSYIHFFLPLSEVPIKSTIFLDKLTYTNTSNDQIPLTDGTLHLDSRLVTGATKPIVEIKKLLDLAATNLVAGVPQSIIDGTRDARIARIFQGVQRQIDGAEAASGDEIEKNAIQSKNLSVIKFIDDWVPVAFQGLTMSTVPNLPESISVSLNFKPFNFLPYTTTFAYIPTVLRQTKDQSAITAGDRLGDAFEFDLALSPVITRWLQRAYLSPVSGDDLLGFYTIPVQGQQNFALEYTYPKILFTEKSTIDSVKSIQMSAKALINFFPQAEVKEEVDDQITGVENIYNMILTSVGVNAGNNFASIPMQSSEIGAMQHMGRQANSVTMELTTDSVAAIAAMRKVDVLFQRVARSTFHESAPVKIKILHPLIQMLGNNNYVSMALTVSSDHQKSGWYIIKMTFVQTGNASFGETLELVDRPRTFSGDRTTETSVIDNIVDDMVKQDANGRYLWSHLIGPLVGYPDSYSADMFETPALLVHLDRNKSDKYNLTYKGMYDGGETVELKNKTGSQLLTLLQDREQPFFSTDKFEGRFYVKARLDRADTNNGYPLTQQVMRLYDNINTDGIDLSVTKSRVEELLSMINIAPVLSIRTVNATGSHRIVPFNRLNQYDYQLYSRKNPNGSLYHGIRTQTYLQGIESTELVVKMYKEVLFDDVTGGVGFGVFDANNNKIIPSTASLGGVYDEPSNRDIFYGARLALYRAPRYSYGTPSGDVNPKNRSEGNLLAYAIATLSTEIFDIISKIKSINKNTNNIREFLKGILIDAMKYSSFAKNVEGVISSLAMKSTKYAEVYGAIPRYQSSYLDLKLPTYNELFGIFGNHVSSIPALREKILQFTTLAGKSSHEGVFNRIIALEKKYGYLTDGVLEINLQGENRSSLLQELQTDMEAIGSLLNGLNSSSLDSRKIVLDQIAKQAPILLTESINLIKAMHGNANSNTETSLYTELKNLPTYRELGVKPALNQLGEADANGPARSGGDYVEPGWQYFSPIIEKNQFGDGDYSDKSVNVEKPIGGEDLSKRPDGAAISNTHLASIQKGTETIQVIHTNKDTKLTEEAAKRDGQVKRNARAIIDEKIRTETNAVTEFTDSTLRRGSDSAPESRKERKDGYANKAGSDYNSDNNVANVNPAINPRNDNYAGHMTKWQQLYKPARIFEMRRAFPTAQLYFLQEAGSAFERWTRFYKYDSIIDIVVTDGKEEVAAAKITLTNFGGYLSNEYNELESAYSRNDIIKNDEITLAKTDDDSWTMGPDGRLVQANRDSLRSRGRILAFDLKPGTKIQIRMGCSSVDDENEIVFNGKIAEVVPGKIIELIAQAHDYELMRHYEGKWEGSYNSFPSIITDMMQYTENFGGWEPYKFDARIQNDASKKTEARRISLSEKIFGYNDTSNDNLYGLQDNGIYINNPLNFWVMIDGVEWYCNGPLLENIYSMRRYIPNFVVSSRPYDERATLYFGPREGAYVYTSKMTTDLVRYNKVIRDQNINQRLLDVYYSHNASHVPREGSREFEDYINGTGPDIVKYMKVSSVIENAGSSLREAPSAFKELNEIDVARLFLRWWNIASTYGKVALEIAELIDGEPRNELKMPTSNFFSSGTEKFVESIPDTIKKNAKIANTLFTPIYRPIQEFSGVVEKSISQGNFLSYRPIVSVDYSIFVREVQSIGTITGDAFKGFSETERNISETPDIDKTRGIINIDKQRTFKEIGKDLKTQLPGIFDFLADLRESLEGFDTSINNGFTEQARNKVFRFISLNKNRLSSPVLYYAVPDLQSGKIAWMGYVSLFNILFHMVNGETISGFKNAFAYRLPKMVIKSNENLKGLGGSAVGQNLIAQKRKVTDFIPNKRPFKLNHTILDYQIVSNNISASKSFMANKVVMWYPDEGSADINEGQMEAGDLKRAEISFAPILSEELVASVFERNAAEADIFDRKAMQVCFEFLGDKLREMYQGDLVILGNERIKPHDMIFFNDTLKGMHGQFEVGRVTHIYDSERGFLTILQPHLCVYVNEDTEARAAFIQCLLETAGTVGPALLAFTFVMGIVSLPLAITVGGILGLVYAQANDASNQRGSQTDQFLGIPLSWPSTVGYTSSFLGLGNDGYSVRRNPCRIDPLVYRGSPLVAGLDNWQKRDWTNRQASDNIKHEIQLGKQVVTKGIANWFTSIGESVDEIFYQFKSGGRAFGEELNREDEI